MAQYDVHPRTSPAVPYIMDVQCNLLQHIATRVAIPLRPYEQYKSEEFPRLKPVVLVNGKKYILMTTEISVVKTSELSPATANLADQRTLITQAIDFLVQGF